jgi:hypothetical protein
MNPTALPEIVPPHRQTATTVDPDLDNVDRATDELL